MSSSSKPKITFTSIMKMSKIDKDLRDVLAERNLTMAGFTLSGLIFIVGFYKEDFSNVTVLILSLLFAMFLFFLGSQFAHEAEYFWQMFLADLCQYSGTILLMASFSYFVYVNILNRFVLVLPILLAVILLTYLTRGAWRIYEFYKDFKTQQELKNTK